MAIMSVASSRDLLEAPARDRAPSGSRVEVRAPVSSGLPVVVSGLCKSYGRTEVLREVELAFAPGELVVLLGPSGSGKSTLLRCLAGIERPGAGQIRIGPQVVAAPGVHVPPERRDLGMVFQDYALWPHLSARDNVAFAARRARRSTRGARADAARAAEGMLERVGLAALADRFPSELSGGEQQRVALARALVAGPGLLLFDEPLSNLDADLRDRLRVEIATLVRASGATALYITHDQAEAFALADRVGILHEGRLVQVATPEEVYRHPATSFAARFTGVAGELRGRLVRAPSGGQALVEAGGSLLEASLLAGGDRRLVPGEDVTLLVRPGAVELCEERDQASVERSGTLRGAPNALAGVVADVAFCGGGYEHVVEVAGGALLGGVRSPLRAERGSNVAVRLDPGGLLVLDA